MAEARVSVLLLACLLSALLIPATLAATYRIGFEGMNGVGADEARAQAQPLVDYFNTVVTDDTFELVIFTPTPQDEAPLLRAVEELKVEFVIADPRTEACMELSGHKALVTFVSAFYGTPQTHTAAAVVVRANDTRINSLSDLTDTRVATCELPLVVGTIFGSHLLRARGVDLLQAPRQVQRYSSLAEPLRALLRGDADAAVLEAGVLEMLVANRELAMADVRVVDETLGSTFSYRHSTRTYPLHGVLRLKHVSSDLANAVKSALLSITPDAPAAVAMNGSGWASSQSNMAVVPVLEKMQLLELRGASMLCHGRSVWQCPEDTFLLGGSAELPCATIPCPAGARCTCRPCTLGDDVTIYNVPVVAGTEALLASASDGIVGNVEGAYGTGFLSTTDATICRRVEDCAVAVIGDKVVFELRDFLASFRPHLAVTAMASNAKGDVPVKVVRGDEAGQWFVEVTLTYLGPHTISVLYGASHAPESPYFVEANLHTCTGEHEEPQSDGSCECSSKYVRSGGACVSRVIKIITIVVPVIVAIILLLILAYYLWRRREERMHLVPYAKLELPATAEVLGSGSFGDVLAARYNGQDVAVKMLTTQTKGSAGPTARRGLPTAGIKGSLGMTSGTAGSSRFGRSKGLRGRFTQELGIMRRLQHANIVSCIGGIIEPNVPPMLVMERMEGTLCELLLNETLDLGWDILSPLMRDIVTGMTFLHMNDVVHCDLKSTNVLVDCNLRAKIGDFGLSAKCKSTSGSPAWMAPELLRGEHNTKASDVYAFGILLSEMLTRKLPYAGMDLAQVLKRIASCDEAELVRPALPLRLPAGMHALVISCWQDDAAARLSMSQVALQIAAMDIQSLSINLFARRADAKNQARVLNDVFPPHVADILKRGEKVRPEHRPEVTLFFSDIVGFTDISAQLTPAKVSDMLDRLYTAFDGLVDKYDLFKVETIGDAYFCASNLVKDQPQHTELMARFAMDAIDAASNTLVDLDLPRLGCIKIRAGIHIGSVVTNVVGTKNPRFCLFGDTVNTASRMESSSIAGYIHCSAPTAEALVRQCPELAPRVRSRGLLNIKGKGEMETFWILLEGQGVDTAEDEAVAARLKRSAKMMAEAQAMVETAQQQHADATSSSSRRTSRFSVVDGVRRRMSAALSHLNPSSNKRASHSGEDEYEAGLRALQRERVSKARVAEYSAVDIMAGDSEHDDHAETVGKPTLARQYVNLHDDVRVLVV